MTQDFQRGVLPSEINGLLKYVEFKATVLNVTSLNLAGLPQ